MRKDTKKQKGIPKHYCTKCYFYTFFIKLFIYKYKKGSPQTDEPLSYCLIVSDYNFGPASTKALPASLPVNLAKFLMKRPAKSLAFSSH